MHHSLDKNIEIFEKNHLLTQSTDDLILNSSDINVIKKTAEREALLRRLINYARSSLNIPEIKKDFVTQIGKYFNADRVIVAEYDEEQKLFMTGDEYSEYLSSPDKKSFIGIDVNTDPTLKFFLESVESLRNLEIQVYTDADKFIRLNNLQGTPTEKYIRDFSVEAGAALTIEYGNHIYGWLAVQYTEKGVNITEDNVDFIKALGNQLGISFYQAKLYSSLEKSMEREKLLRKLITTVRSTLDLDEMLIILCDEIGKAFDVDRCSIIQFTDPNDYTKWSLKREYKSFEEVKTIKEINMHKDVGLFWGNILFDKGKSFFIENIPESSNLPEILKSSYKNLDLKTLLGIPIKKDNDNWGGLFLSNTKSFKKWTDEEIKLLEVTSDQIYIAVNQAELFLTIQKNAERKKILAEIMEVIKSNLKLEEVLIVICGILRQFYNVNKIVIAKLDSEEKILKPLKESCNDDKNLKKYTFSLKSKNYFYEKIIKNKNLVININDVETADNPGYLLKDLELMNIKALMMVPIFINANETGAIIIQDNKNKSWREEDTEFLLRVSDYIAIAIKESNLYNQAEFVANISHELKTPLSVIAGYTDVLLNLENPDLETTNKFLNIIKNNSERLNKLIDNLFCISNIEKNLEYKSIVFEKSAVIDLIENSIKICDEKIKSKNIKIEKSMENIFIKKANSVLLQQLLINLITNAVNYSETDSVIKLNASIKNKEILISVQDTGCGIKSEYLPNIFERFYRVDKSRSRDTGGSGLGLYISKIISKIHDGYITAESVFGKGSTFTLHLPE